LFIFTITIISIVGLAVGLVFLVGNKAQTQVIVPQNTSAGLLAPVITTDPSRDTDHDGLLDSDEVTVYHTDPLQIDTDNDGLADYQEIKVYHTDPLNSDTDHDGYRDGDEVQTGFSPLLSNQIRLEDADTDHDGLKDALEIKLGTDLTNPDTDNDGILDGQEVFSGSNPLIAGDDRSVERHVEVDLTHQQLHYFMNNVELGTFPISSGLPSKPTPRGEFTIFRKLPIAEYKNDTPGDEYDLKNVHWNLEFKHGYFLHEAYWHNQFGIRSMSHGCINMRLDDVAQMYQFLDIGDKVIVYGKTPIGRVKPDVAPSSTVGISTN
jgi:lipoprotein-anchoring transpeptidase ErfK/SrfK